MIMFEDSKILITGGTGSLGKALTKRLLKMDVKTIGALFVVLVICQHMMAKKEPMCGMCG